MATSNLPTTSSNGTQLNAQAPPSSTSTSSSTLYNNISSNSIQSVNSTNYLTTGNGGLTLTPTALSTVSLNSSTGASSNPSTGSKSGHHVNVGLFSVAILLFGFAVVLFWMTSNSSKKTT